MPGKKNKRPTWDEYFLKLAMLASERATCPRMHVGCVLVKDKFVLALVQATTHGINIKGTTAYITNMSCTNCAKALIAAGIKRVVVFSDYHDTLATKFYNDAGVEIAKLKMPDKKINYDLQNYSSAKKTSRSG